MPLSASTLIHFTDQKEHLKSILRENFRIFNCREEVHLGSKRGGYVAPMVSFCDIPLSEVKIHIEKYGSYGIGLTKAWGVRHKLNPVLYVSKGSHLSESYRRAFIHFAEDAQASDGDWSIEQKSLVDVLRYVKNYEADLTRKNKTVKRYRFSDEREWRYVPPFGESCEMIIPLGEYDEPARRAQADRLLEDLRLEFSPEDIKYIIIKDDSEISEFIDHLRRAKGKKYSLDEVERLATRILTAEQIRDDM